MYLINSRVILTDEELGRYKTLPCPVCKSKNTNVRYAGQGWYFVGCLDCGHKRTCDESYIEQEVEFWNNYSRKVAKNVR